MNRHTLTLRLLFLSFSTFQIAGTLLGEDEQPAEAEKKVDDGGPAAALREGRYDEAAEGFRKAHALGGEGAPAAARGLAESLVAEGKYAQALEALESAKAQAPSAVVLCGMGRLHLRLGRLDMAEKAFRAAVEASPGGASPDKVEGLNRLGETLWKQGKVAEAREAWEKVVDIYKEMSSEDVESVAPEVFVEMALALVGLNRFREANDVMFSQAQEKDPKNPALLLEQGRILLRKYSYKDAPVVLREAVDENPRSADALAALADYYLTDFQVGTKRYELAEKNLKKALEVNPSHAEAYLLRGVLWFSDGNIDEGLADFRKSVELDPSSLRARGYVAACLFLAADEAQLAQAEKEALAVNPRGAEFFHTIALAIENKFRYRDSVRFCDRALELDPEYWPAFVTLGINCLRTGEEERGRKFLERSWENDKFNVWVFNTRVLLRHMDANYKELKTDRFVFKFPKEDFSILRMTLVPLLEKAHDTLSIRYKTELPRPVYVEVFSAHKWFSARTVGLEGFAASGACFGNLVTLTTPKALPQNWAAVAWHEFAHVATLALTRHRVPRWLTEGLSVFEEGRDHPTWARNFEREIADTYASGRLLPLRELDFGFSKPKYPMQILISYFQGCLISMYIEEKWGFDSILAILDGYGKNKGTAEVFEDVLDLSLEEFDRGFFEYVRQWIEKNGYEPTIAPDRIPVLQAEAEADPKNARKLVDLAWAFLSSGDSEVDATLSASKALEIEPENADAHAVLGLQALAEKKLPQAKTSLEKALAGGTRFRFRAHTALARIAQRDGDKQGAIDHLEKAKAISPRAGAAYPSGRNLYYQLHDLYQETGKTDLAMEQMEAVTRHDPEDGEARTRLASHYMKLEGEDAARKAIRWLQEVLFINPYEKPAHEYLARAAAKVGEHDLVIREYEYLLEFPDTNPKVAYLALAKAHSAKGNGPRAVDFAKKLLEIDDGNDEAKEILKKFGG